VEGLAGQDGGMIRPNFCSEIETLLPVGFPGRAFPANRKIPAPGATAPGHGDLHLLLFALVEKLAAQNFQFAAQRLIYTVTDDIEESTFPARSPNLLTDLSSFRCAIHQRGDIDDGNLGKLAETHPTTMLRQTTKKRTTARSSLDRP
jgi:hypothetical protein